MEPIYLSIQPVETGKRIKQLLSEQHYTVHEIQGAFGFENPQAIYKWLSGKSLPSLDNFVILSRILNTSIENILVIDGDIPHLRTFSVIINPTGARNISSSAPFLFSGIFLCTRAIPAQPLSIY